MAKVKVTRKKAAQILTVPAAAIVDTNNSAKNHASDAVKANTNSPPKYKNYKSERNRKARNRSKSKVKGPSTRDSKKLRLPTASDSAIQIIDGANDFEKFTGELIDYATGKMMSQSVINSINLVTVNNSLVFPSHLPIPPTMDPNKRYEVKIEAKVATSNQIQALATSGVINPSLVPSGTSSSVPTGSSSSNTGTNTRSSKAKTIDPDDSDDDMSKYEAVIVDGDVLLIPRQKRFVTKSFTGREIEMLQVTCKDYLEDLEKHKKACEIYDKEIIKINAELPSLAQKMWKLISNESQSKVAKLMGCEIENAKSLIRFETLRDHIRDTHHPQFHTASPNTRDFFAKIEDFATSELQTAKLLMSSKESLFEYKSRISILLKRLKTAAAIGVKATAAGHVGFTMPSDASLVQRVINSVSAVSAPKAFELCNAYRGTILGFTPATPATVDALFEELEKVQAKADPKQIARQKKKADKEKFLANVHATMGNLDIPEITSMFTAGKQKRSRRGKLLNKDGKPYQRADIKDALRVQVDPDKLDEKASKYIFDAIKKKHPEFLNQEEKQEPKSYKKKSKADGRHRKQPKTVASHHTSTHDSSDAELSDEEEDDEDDEDDDDDDDDEEDSDLSEILVNFNLAPSNLYYTLAALEIPNLSDEEVVLMGLRDPRIKPTRSRINYSRERFNRVDRFRSSKLSVSVEGAVVHDSGSGIHIIRDIRLLVKGSIRKISKENRLKVQGTFPGAHVPKFFAVHKLLGFCIYDPMSKANIISQTQAWASGWMYHTDNISRKVYMTHPSTPTGVYRFEVGRENVLTGVDPTSFDTWDPTHSVKPTSVLSTFIQDNVIKNKLPQSLSPEDLQFSEEEMMAFAFPTVTDHHGRQCSCKSNQ